MSLVFFGAPVCKPAPSSFEEQLFKRIGRKATKLGMKWEEKGWPGFNYETKAHLSDTHADLIHELAHFLVSPERLRHEPYFGIGHPAFGDPKPLLPYKRCYNLETEASILGIVMYREFRAPLRYAVEMAREHNWNDPMDDTPKDTIKRLKRKGLWNDARQKTWDAVMCRV